MKNVNLLMVFPGNDFPVFLITKCFILDVKEFLDSPLRLIHYTCKNTQLIILIVFKSKIQRFFLFFLKKKCLFCFLCDYYGDYLNFMFLQSPNHFLPFPMVFLNIFPTVSTISLDVSTVFPSFPIQILQFDKM